MIIVLKAQFHMAAGHCTSQLVSRGAGGPVSHTVGPGKGNEDPAFYITKDIRKITFYDSLLLHFLLFFYK